MRSILDHPLFTPPKSAASAPKTVKSRDGPAAQLVVANPLLSLDRALAAGTADLGTLIKCIRAHWFSMLGIPDAPFRQKLRTSGVSERVDSWLLSSERESRRRLFSNRRTVALLLPYFVGEKRQAVVLDWLRRMRSPTVDDDPSVPKPLSQCENNVIFEYVAAEIKYGTIGHAMEFYVRLRRLVASLDGQKHHDLFHVYLPSMESLARNLVSPGYTNGLKAELFEMFCGLHKEFHESTYFWGAFLPVYHPTTPTAGPALKFLRSGAKSYVQTPLLCQVSLAAAELCIEQERHADASWLIKYTKNLLPHTTKSPNHIKTREILSPSDISRRLTPALG